MHFGEYELFPSLIGLSPLPTVHPEAFQRLSVRTSSWCYPTFILTMGRSQGFASTPSDCRPVKTCFRYGFSAERINLCQRGVTRRIIMQKARRHALRLPAIALRPLVGTWFQVHIPPLTGVLLIFRSLYLFTIGRQGVFSLTGWSP